MPPLPLLYKSIKTISSFVIPTLFSLISHLDFWFLNAHLSRTGNCMWCSLRLMRAPVSTFQWMLIFQSTIFTHRNLTKINWFLFLINLGFQNTKATFSHYFLNRSLSFDFQLWSKPWHLLDHHLALGDRYRKLYRTLNNAKKTFNSIFNSNFFQHYSFKILFI